MTTKAEPREILAVLPPQSVYALCDEALLARRGIDMDDYIACCRGNDVKIIQYRNKDDELSIMLERLQRLRRQWEGLLIVNDAAELAYLCDGFHLGQDDLAAIDSDFEAATRRLRDMIGHDKIIGLSTHNLEEIETANALDIDYIGLGAYRATATKGDAAVLSESLDTLAARSRHPVAAIGGVRFSDRFEHARFRVIGSAMLDVC